MSHASARPLVLTFGTTPAISRTMQFETLLVDGVNRATRVYEYAAGKSVNAARAARAVGGVDALCVTTVGGGRGEAFKGMLEAEGIRHRLVAVSPQTRLVITAVDRAAGTATELIEDTAEVEASTADALLREFEAAAVSAAVVVMSGSLARGLPADLYGRCVRAADGRPTILDASGDALRQTLDARPTVIKVNAGELASIAPGETIAAAREVVGRTGGWVIVTRGKASTLAAHAREGIYEVSVPPVDRVVSAIGSGDSFAGGLAAALAQGESMHRALAIGSACATANVLTADAAHFDPAVMRRMVEAVRVVRVSG